ncbi:AMP-binding protein [Streptomyces sp. NPDC026589]|uniref:AMP-binding protein n=1 Tax=Streptomyces sp. NPDC026589 TaxID=3155609 RepID=UPI00340CA9F2
MPPRSSEHPAAPAPPTPGTDGLHLFFARSARLRPERTALRTATGDLTYGQLHDDACQWAGTLLDELPGPRRVAVLARRGETAYTGLLAALYTGAAVVPLNPDLPPARTRAALAQARVDAVIADEAGAALLPLVLARADSVPVLVTGPATVPGPCPGPVLRPRERLRLAAPRPVPPGAGAYLMFTSGSTGRPKGVPVSHANATAFLRTVLERYRFTPEDVFSQTFDLTFDLAVFDLFAAWASGATVVSTPWSALLDLPAFAKQHGLTVWFSTPTSIALAARGRRLRSGSLPGLRWSLFCGEPLTVPDARLWQAAADRSRLENLYGPTELTVACTAHRWDPDRSPALSANKVVPIGSLFAGLTAVLLERDGREASEEGELCVAGAQLVGGYCDPADDAGRFVHRAGRSWYRTGDLVRRIPGGEYVFLGRLDDQVKVNGWRVELGEVEAALRSLPGVERAVAVQAPGDGGIACFYTGTPRPPAELKAGLAGRLPRAVLPDSVEHRDELPLTASGKVDRHRLAGTLAGGTDPEADA